MKSQLFIEHFYEVAKFSASTAEKRQIQGVHVRSTSTKTFLTAADGICLARDILTLPLQADLDTIVMPKRYKNGRIKPIRPSTFYKGDVLVEDDRFVCGSEILLADNNLIYPDTSFMVPTPTHVKITAYKFELLKMIEGAFDAAKFNEYEHCTVGGKLDYNDGWVEYDPRILRDGINWMTMPIMDMYIHPFAPNIICRKDTRPMGDEGKTFVFMPLNREHRSVKK
jgi:hypothetical protein